MQESIIPLKVSRRLALQRLAVSVGIVAAIPAQRALSSIARVDPATHLDVKDPAAVAVGYVESAEKVDAKKFPDFVAGSNCENCLQLEGKAGVSYRPCTVFPGKLVAAAGWCSAWTAEI